VFVFGTTALVVLACRNPSDLVAANYYEQEIRFQTQLDRVSRAQQLSARASASYDAAGRRIVIALPLEHVAGAVGRIQLYRPSEAGLDQRLDLQLDATGIQTIDVRELTPGLWKVKVDWNAGGHDYFLDRQIVIQRGNS
jgi:nitrogen fixation protein FixH